MGALNTPLGGGLRSSGYQDVPRAPEFYVQPSQVDLGDGNIPGMHGTSGGPATWEGNTGDLYQDTHASYAGVYVPDFLDVPGPAVVATQLAPATGSENLVAPRDAFGVPGTNRAIHSAGPVTGTSDNAWSGRRAATVPRTVGSSGPVTGGQDVNQAAARAYYSQQASMISQAMAEASLMAVV